MSRLQVLKIHLPGTIRSVTPRDVSSAIAVEVESLILERVLAVSSCHCVAADGVTFNHSPKYMYVMLDGPDIDFISPSQAVLQ